jgi:hypothetical protein
LPIASKSCAVGKTPASVVLSAFSSIRNRMFVCPFYRVVD